MHFFVLLKMTKLHSAISQVINTQQGQHGLRSIMQTATPVVCTGKLSMARASERQVGLIMKPTRNRQSKDRLSQLVFSKLNLIINNRIVFLSVTIGSMFRKETLQRASAQLVPFISFRPVAVRSPWRVKIAVITTQMRRSSGVCSRSDPVYLIHSRLDWSRRAARSTSTPLR